MLLQVAEVIRPQQKQLYKNLNKNQRHCSRYSDCLQSEEQQIDQLGLQKPEMGWIFLKIGIKLPIKLKNRAQDGDRFWKEWAERNISHNIVFQSHTCTMENILKYERWECGAQNSETFIFQFEFSLCLCTSSLKWNIIYYFKYYPLVFDCIFNFSNELKWKKVHFG